MLFARAVLFALVAPSAADIVISRTINTLAAGSSANVTVEGSACSKVDAHGSDACDVHWGDAYAVDLDVTLGQDLTAGAKVNVDMKLDDFIKFKFECAVCGTDCTVTVPIIKKTFTIPMPACPISKRSLQKRISAALPSKSPVPLRIGAKGTVQVTDATGAVLVDMNVEGKVSPSGVAIELEANED